MEVFVRRTGEEPDVVPVPPKRPLPAALAEILSRYVDRDGRLQGDPAEAVPALVRDLDGHRAAVRISKEVGLWAAGRARRAARAAERQKLEDDLRSGSRSHAAALKLLDNPVVHLVCAGSGRGVGQGLLGRGSAPDKA
ncbi:MAG: hypothetical protein HY216_14150, partial [Candidatus Rokubacteria bacterium]|nr:hypothetical protein [Candidatus Rokubacteria bacterium]